MPCPRAGDVERLSLVDPTGRAYEVLLPWTALASSETSGCARFGTAEVRSDYEGRPLLASGRKWCLYDGGAPDLRVVRWVSFEYATTSELADDENALLSTLRGAGVGRVLFDVRENGGGHTDPTFFGNFASTSYTYFADRLYAAPALVRDPGLVAKVIFMDPGVASMIEDEVAKAIPGTFTPEFPGQCRTPGCPRTDLVYPPLPSPLRAVVLTGPECVSACDQFVAMMKDNGLAKLAGLPPAAADSTRRYWVSMPLADGEAFDLVVTVAVSDHPGTQTPLEAHPPELDFPVMSTSANRGSYLTAVMAAITW
jgi:hypothetical protein